MEKEYKIIKAYGFDGFDGFRPNGEYFKIDKSFEIPKNKIILLAPFYKPKHFTLNFYKVSEEIPIESIDMATYKTIDTTPEPVIVANINIDFYIDFCNEKERLHQIEKELKQATKDISFYMQMKTLAEMNPEKYGPLVEEWKKLSFKENATLLDSTTQKAETNK